MLIVNEGSKIRRRGINNKINCVFIRDLDSAPTRNIGVLLNDIEWVILLYFILFISRLI